MTVLQIIENKRLVFVTYMSPDRKKNSSYDKILNKVLKKYLSKIEMDLKIK